MPGHFIACAISVYQALFFPPEKKGGPANIKVCFMRFNAHFSEDLIGHNSCNQH